MDYMGEVGMMDDLNLVQLNWELCMAYLTDTISELEECISHLNKALVMAKQ